MSFTCEVVAVGTELLLGQGVDTNSTWIGERLAAAGIDSHFHSKVGDNRMRIVSVLRLALERSDAVIVCGGLGPTHDDLTREAIAEVMGAELDTDAATAERIRALFDARGRSMPGNNLRQARVPVGATVIEQRRGTAPGLICPVREGVVYAVPGVPHEMREMVERAVLPDLRGRAGDPAVIVSRELRTWGDSESGLAERLAPMIERLDREPGVTIAILASGIEGIRVRLTAKAEDRDTAIARIAEEERTVRESLGSLVFGVDDTSMEDVVLQLLVRRSRTLALVEEITAGRIAGRLQTRLARHPEARGRFAGALVAPTPDATRRLLGTEVPFEEAAAALAEAVARAFGTDLGLAVTGRITTAGDLPRGAGSAGPAGPAAGNVHVGLHLRDHTEQKELRLPGTPDTLRDLAAISALDLLRRRLV